MHVWNYSSPARLPSQVAMFSSRGLAAACITGEVHNDSHLRAKVMGGEFQLLFIGPELLLLHPLWREMVRVPVYVKKLVCFAV